MTYLNFQNPSPLLHFVREMVQPPFPAFVWKSPDQMSCRIEIQNKALFLGTNTNSLVKLLTVGIILLPVIDHLRKDCLAGISEFMEHLIGTKNNGTPRIPLNTILHDADIDKGNIILTKRQIFLRFIPVCEKRMLAKTDIGHVPRFLNGMGFITRKSIILDFTFLHSRTNKCQYFIKNFVRKLSSFNGLFYVLSYDVLICLFNILGDLCTCEHKKPLETFIAS